MKHWAKPSLLLLAGLMFGLALSRLFDAILMISILAPFLIAMAFLVWLTRKEIKAATTSQYDESVLRARIDQAVRQERERIYRNLHDDIGAQLLNLVYKAADPQAADLARVALQNLREAIAKTVDKRLTVPELLGDMRNEMEGRLQPTGIHLQWQVEPKLNEQALQAPQAIAISRIFRECLSNTLKHANAATITFSASQQGAQIALQFCDDGVGTDSDKPAKPGRGLRSMTERAKQIGAQLQSQNAKQGGFSVTLTLTVNATLT